MRQQRDADADRGPVHRRDHGLGEVVERAHEAAHGRLGGRDAVVFLHVFILQVGAAGEIVARAGHDHDVHARVVARGLQAVEVPVHGAVQERQRGG